MSPSYSRPYYPVLDSLRGVCAVLVALFHLRANSHFESMSLIRNGWLFVDFFFVLSGFVIAENYCDRLVMKAVSIWRFIWLRLARLYPLHLFMIFLFVATECGIAEVYEALGKAGREPFTDSRSLELLPENILLLQSLGISGVQSWNVPSWSISAEFWTYCLFALFFGAALWRRVLWFSLCLFVGPVTIFAIHGPTIALEFDGGILRCLFGFGTGVLLSRLRWPQSVPQSICIYGEVPAVLLVLAFVCYAPGLQMTLAAPLVFALTVIIFAKGAGPLSRYLRSGVFLWLGALSYSIYMVHTYMHARFKNLGFVAEKLTDRVLFLDAEKTLFGTSIWIGDLFVIVVLIATIALSYVTWRLIEKPGQAYLVNLSKRQPVEAVSKGSYN